MNNITRAQAAECHMIAVTCRGIISLFDGHYSSSDINDYMSTYISDLKKYDEDIANTVKSKYAHEQIDDLLAYCKQQVADNSAIVEQVLCDKSCYDVYTYDAMMQDTRKFVETLKATVQDDFYSEFFK